MAPVGAGDYIYEYVQYWAKLPPGQSFGTCSAVATDSQDHVYVFQRKHPPVLVFDPDGNYLSCWGIGVFAEPRCRFGYGA